MSQQNENRADQHGFAPYQSVDGEPYMSAAQEAHFSGILNAWRRELMEEVDRTVDHMKIDSVHCPDPNDRASQESDIGLELLTRERERRLLNKIQHALKLLDEHDYGYCESCGQEIGIRRLEARPTAELCIDCKTREEERERLQA